MRDRKEIEREMYIAREDLEQNLDELKHAVREKVDLRARALAAFGERKQQAFDLARRGRDYTKQRPFLVGGILAGVILGAIGMILLVRRRERAWYERLADVISP
jgi:hypothetical protein